MAVRSGFVLGISVGKRIGIAAAKFDLRQGGWGGKPGASAPSGKISGEHYAREVKKPHMELVVRARTLI